MGNKNLKNINNYNILDIKGEGRCGKVYLAEDKKTKKKYAKKILNEKSDLYKNEVEILEKVSLLNSRYIINIKEYGESPIKIDPEKENKQYIILDYASKGELYNYIDCTQKGLNEKYAKLIFGKILRGVQSFHKAGICHRDLKMQNILLDELYNPKICDFGSAIEIKGKDGSRKLNDYAGTPSYAAPEMYLEKPYDGIKSDIFSLGVILLSITTLKFMFNIATSKNSFYKYIIIGRYKQWKNFLKIKYNISEELINLYFKMISFNPDERPTIDEILKNPWMKEVEELKEDEYIIVEKDVNKEFQKLEKILLEKNETIHTDGKEETKKVGNRSLLDDEEEITYFNPKIPIKNISKIGLKMKNFIKITGNLNPHEFMNSLANKILSEFRGKCECNIIPDENKLKFDVIFEKNGEYKEEIEEENEDENEEINKEIEEKFQKLGIEYKENFEDIIQNQINTIQIKLFKTINGEYILRFIKKEGEIEDYNKNLEYIIQLVKKLLKINK